MVKRPVIYGGGETMTKEKGRKLRCIAVQGVNTRTDMTALESLGEWNGVESL